MSHTEYLVDQIQNVNVRGPLVTVSYGRAVGGPEEPGNNLEDRVQITMTTPNFVNTVNALNQIVKRMSEQKKANQNEPADLGNQDEKTE